MAKLIIGSGPYEIIAATDKADLIAGAVILEENKGWDDTPSKERNTAKKPNGDGDWVSEYFTWNSRLLEITLTTATQSGGVRVLRDKIAHWEAANFFPLELTRVEGGDIITERIEGCYTLGNTLWKEAGSSYGAGKYASANLSIKTPGAFKLRAVNGSTPIQAL